MKEHLQPGISEMVSISEDDLTSDCGSIADAFAQVVNDITGGNVPVDIALPLKIENAYSNNALPIVFLSFQTDRSRQIVQTQIRLLLEELSDLGLHYLHFGLHHLSLFVRKPVFGVSDQVQHKPGCTATEDG